MSDLTLWLVTQSQQYDGYDGMQWSDEDADIAADRGYFFTRDDAQEWIDFQKQRRIDEGRAKHEDELERVNADALTRYEAKVAQESARRVEYDVLVAAGVSPTFDRPAVRAPFAPRTTRFNEEVYFRGLGLRWEIVEMEPCDWKQGDEETTI